MSLTVRIDRDACISGGKCVADAPQAFHFDDEQLAEVLPGAAELSDERLKKIARNCPGQAIVLVGDDGAEIDPMAV